MSRFRQPPWYEADLLTALKSDAGETLTLELRCRRQPLLRVRRQLPRHPRIRCRHLLRSWQRDGSQRYRNASELPVLAHSGASNAPPRPLLQVRPPDPSRRSVLAYRYRLSRPIGSSNQGWVLSRTCERTTQAEHVDQCTGTPRNKRVHTGRKSERKLGEMCRPSGSDLRGLRVATGTDYMALGKRAAVTQRRRRPGMDNMWNEAMRRGR